MNLSKFLLKKVEVKLGIFRIFFVRILCQEFLLKRLKSDKSRNELFHS